MTLNINTPYIAIVWREKKKHIVTSAYSVKKASDKIEYISLKHFS